MALVREKVTIQFDIEYDPYGHGFPEDAIIEYLESALLVDDPDTAGFLYNIMNPEILTRGRPSTKATHVRRIVPLEEGERQIDL